MAKTGTLKHTHQYYKSDISGLWHCSGYGGCTHYMPGNMPPPVGRRSLCWRCEMPFILAPYNMVNNRPVCDNCEELREPSLEDYMAQHAAKRQKSIEAGHEPDCEAYLGGVCNCTQIRNKQDDEIEVYEPTEENNNEN